MTRRPPRSTRSSTTVPCPTRVLSPEALPDALGLVHDLLLFEQLGEQDVERDDRHDDENAERHLRNQAAFAKSGDEAVRIGARGGRGARGKNGQEHLALFLARSIFRTGDWNARGQIGRASWRERVCPYV